jgi:hypothetical protein
VAPSTKSRPPPLRYGPGATLASIDSGATAVAPGELGALDGDDCDFRIQGSDVIRIRGGDPVAVPSSAQYDGGVDDIGRASDTAQLTCRARALIVESLYRHFSGAEQAREASLTAPIVPDLTQGACRHRQRVCVVEGACEQGDETPVVPPKGNQRPRV